jgi:glycosyltransferase involved in cell wall biosynthesis
VLIVITGLEGGGAETMLLKLCQTLRSREDVRISVLALKGGRIETPLSHCVESLIVAEQLLSRAGVLILVRWLRSVRPDIIQGWMLHGDLFATALKLVYFFRPLVWNLRWTFSPDAPEKPLTMLIPKILGIASHFLPKTIICNSNVAAVTATSKCFYSNKKWRIIPNGFDLDRFAPSSSRRREIRDSLGISHSVFVFGHVARFHPMKDHALFLRAISRVAEVRPSIVAVLLGKDTDGTGAAALTAHSSTTVIALGERENVAELMTCFDAFVLSSSHGEGFPNVIGEAMAVGLPCVVTDVGDCRFIVGENGFVVPPKNEELMVNALLRVLDLPAYARLEIGLRNRRRAASLFSLDAISAAYLSAWNEALR